ncbi:MAG TPA: SPFH domain-containing protein [Anaerolineae bacterium]
MNTSKLLAMLGLLVFGLLVGLLVGSLVGWLAGWLVIILAALAFTAWLVNGYIWIRVGEMETAVVFNVERKSFVRFLPPGRHRLLFPLEQIKDVISTAPTSVRGTVLKAQTHGGITIGADWSLIYVFNPDTTEGHLKPVVARVLPGNANQLLRGHVNNCLARVISRHTVETLSDEGARRRLERELRDEVVGRLRPFGIEVFRIMVTGVDLPHPVQEALEAAHERELYASSEARSLERLQQAVSHFSEEDMQRLAELKRIHMLGRNGVALPIPMVWPINGQSQKDRRWEAWPHADEDRGR